MQRFDRSQVTRARKLSSRWSVHYQLVIGTLITGRSFSSSEESDDCPTLAAVGC